MAHLYRLGAAVLLALTLAMVWTPASASFSAVRTGGNASGKASWEASNKPNCDAWAGSSCVVEFDPVINGGDYCGGTNQINGDCYLMRKAAGPVWSTYYVTGALSCPADSTLSGSQCTCTPPKVQNAAGTGCETENLCAGFNGLVTPSTTNEARTSNMTTAGMSAAIGQTRNHCVAGCVASGTVQAAFRANTGETTLIISDSKFNGSSCDITAAPGSGEGGTSVAQAEPTLCSKSGKCPGQVNGLDVCVPCAASGTSSSLNTVKLDTASPPAGSASGTPGTSGTTTENKTEKTVCEGSKCTTTSSSTKSNPDGTTSTAVVTADKPKSEFCKDNPRDKSCLDGGGSFGGSCEGGFTCEGDAVQCATAQAVNKQNCIMNKPSSESALYDIEKAKTGNQTGNLPGNSTVSIGSGSFDSSDAIGGAACIADKSVVVAGKTIVIGFSVICPWLDNLKNILLAVSYLAAAGIVFRR